MKGLILKILSVISYIFPLSLLIKLSGKRIIYPFYHIISDNPPAHIKHLYTVRSTNEFRKDLDFLSKHFIPQNSISEIEKTTKQNVFFLSFDDGLSECYEVIAPILKEYNIKATFFLNSGFIDNEDLFFKNKASIIINEIVNKGLSTSQKTQITGVALSKKLMTEREIKLYIRNIRYSQQIKLDRIAELLAINFKDYLQKNKPYLTSNQIKVLLADGHQIGAHSINHPLYSELEPNEQKRQTSESIEFIENKFDIKVKLFAFPFTDDKLTSDFFNQIFESNTIDYTLGTAGIKDDCVERNIQRIPIENYSMSARRIIKTEYLLYILKKMLRKHIVHRH